MPRDLSSAALAKVAETKGNSPVFVIEVQWVKDGPRTSYADKDFAGVYGKILQISGLDNVVNVTLGSDSQQISVTLDDTDGSLKEIIDNNDIHKRPCWVYQAFDGLSLAEKFLVFKGVISSPLEWDEGDRSLKFDVISQIEDTEIGFSAEEGDFPGLDENLIGRPWPLCFGTVINVPALRAVSPFSGTLATGVGIRDFTLANRLKVAENLPCDFLFLGFRGEALGGNYRSIFLRPIFEVDPQCVRDHCVLIEQLKLQIQEQSSYEYATIRVFGGDRFPQGQQITLDIGGGLFTGSFSGDIFTITNRRHPDMGPDGKLIRENFQKTITSTCGGKFDGISWKRTSNWQSDPNIAAFINKVGIEHLDLDPNFQPPGITPITPQEPAGVAAFYGISGIPSQSSVAFLHAVFNAMSEADFFWANAGTEVKLVTGQEIVYIANILPSTVLRVAAYRNLETGRKLLTVPASYYTVRLTDYTGYTVTEIVLQKPLSEIDESWDDDIYVTLTSSVGPNTVDELEWLIDTYTDFDIDSTSFDDVKAKIDNYPMHFLMPGRKNIVNVLQEMAEQARCAIWLRDDKFFLKYLAEEPAADDTITPSDVLANTLKISHTSTEDLVTKFVVEWQDDYAKQKANKLILRHNVSKYGTQEREYQYYCFNILDLVRKAATFWLIRRANTWRLCSFQTPITKLATETFDTLQIDVDQVTPNGVKAVVETANYDSDSRTIQFECWTPLKSGSLVPYDFAWPAAVDENLLFPTIDEREQRFAGSGKEPNFSTIAPPNHPLRQPPQGFSGFQLQCNGFTQAAGNDFAAGDEWCRGDHGDKAPSDIGDQKPEPKAAEDDNGDFNQSTDPVGSSKDCCAIAKQALEEARKALKEAQKDDGGGGSDGGEKDKEDGKCQLPDQGCVPGPCQHVVKVTYDTITRIQKPDGSFDPPLPGQEGGGTGVVVALSGAPEDECHTFNSEEEAKKFRKFIVDEKAAKDQGFGWALGERYPFTTSLTSGAAEDGGDCTEPPVDERGQTGYSGPGCD